MKISVVIPLYNKEQSILRAINSVLDQSEQDFEIVVVNDGSTDKSAALVANIAGDTRIRLLSQENAGVSAARNRGVAEARSELIAFLDADDEWFPEYLKIILELRTQFPDGSVYCTLYSVQENDGSQNSPNTDFFFNSDYRGYIFDYLDIIRSVLPFNMSSFSVKKNAFLKIGGFPIGIKYGEDVDLFIRLSLKQKIVYANRSLALYHRDAENRACKQYEQLSEEYYPVTNLALMVKRGEVPIHVKQSAIEYVAKHRLNLAKDYLHYENPNKARELIRSCVGTKIYREQWKLLYMCTLIPPRIYKSLIKMKHRFSEQLG